MSTVTVTTAAALSSQQKTKVKQAMEKKYGKGTEFEFVVDESVIGGVKITAGSTQVDGTFRNKLDSIKIKLLEITD